MRLIKRYSNRKLYDTTDKQYTTLHRLADNIRKGEEVKVQDHATSADLTVPTLAQIVFEEAKLNPQGVPEASLVSMIKAVKTMTEAPVG